MAVFLEQQDLLFVTIPKVACTTMKAYLAQCLLRTPYWKSDFGQIHPNVHDFFKVDTCFGQLSEAQRRATFKFALVRNPVDRLFSAYTNKVVNAGVLQNPELSKPLPSSVPSKPSFDEFVDYIDVYTGHSEFLELHCHALHFFLGERPQIYTRLMDIKQTDEMISELNERFGFSGITRVMNATAGPGFKPTICTKTQGKILTRYQRDYDLYGHIFD